MPVKIFEHPEIGKINIYKRRASRSIRLSFSSNGDVRVSVPSWVPYKAGLDFATNKKDWILEHRPAQNTGFKDGDRIGKAHRLQILPDGKVKTTQVRLSGSMITVKHPSKLSTGSIEVQNAAERGAKKALFNEANKLLPQKLNELAQQHGFTYKSVLVKQLKTKWGSCNQFHEITLNYYLMQLPWNLIEYVLLHELTHTEHLNHSNAFWKRFEQVLPGAKKIRKELKIYRTNVVATN